MMSLERFKQLTGCRDEALAAILLTEAEQMILSETNRNVMIKQLENARMSLAITMYNRLGTEGESSRSEGGISSTFEEMPRAVKNAISHYRLARVGGHAFETMQNEEVLPQKV